MRRSIVGPVILIALGVVFLLPQLIPGFTVSSLFTKYWPFLLIGWGVLRLAEVIALQTQGKPLTRGLSGGEIFGIIVICLIGTGARATEMHMPSLARIGGRGAEIFGETYEYPVSLTTGLPAKAKVVFDVGRGNVRINGGDGTELRITGRKTIRSYDRSSADRQAEQAKFEIVNEGDRTIVRTNQDRVADNKGVSIELDVVLPRDASVIGRGRLGDFDVTDITGGVEIESDNAGVRLNQIGGDVRVDLGRSDEVKTTGIKGNVTVKARNGDRLEIADVAGQATVNGSFSGGLDFRNIGKTFRFESQNTELTVVALPGRVEMDLGRLDADNLTGPVKLTSRTKDVKFENFTDTLDIDLNRGDIDIVAPAKALPKINARTRNGSLEISLPAAAKFGMRATIERGDANNEFGDPLKVTEDGRKKTIEGKTGVGPELTLSAERGSITIRKQ